MSYNDSAFYVAEAKAQNHLEAPLKPSLGINPGRNAPVIKSNDKNLDVRVTVLQRKLYNDMPVM
jgi:hypothetical protein